MIIARKKKTIESEVIKRMKELGVYKVEYRNTINIYVDMLHQYESLNKEFEDSGYQVEEPYTNKAGATNMRKTPTLAALEKLRMDLATYSNLLCLNPREHIKSKTDQTGKSSLASVLEKMGG